MGFLSDLFGGKSPIDAMGEGPGMLGIEMSNDPFLGGFFSNPADQQLKDQLRANRMAIQNYRQQAPIDRSQAMNQAFGLFGPANSALAAMYGPGAAIDFGQVAQPVGQGLAGITPQTAQPPGMTNSPAGAFSNPFGPEAGLAMIAGKGL